MAALDRDAAYVPGEWRCKCPGGHGRMRPDARGCPRCGQPRPAWASAIQQLREEAEAASDCHVLMTVDPRLIIDILAHVDNLHELLREWFDLSHLPTGGYGGTLRYRTEAELGRLS